MLLCLAPGASAAAGLFFLLKYWVTKLIASANTAPYAVTDTNGNQLPDEQEGQVDADVQNYLATQSWKQEEINNIPKLSMSMLANGNLVRHPLTHTDFNILFYVA